MGEPTCKTCGWPTRQCLGCSISAPPAHEMAVDPIPALRDAVVDAAKAFVHPDNDHGCAALDEAVAALLAAESAARSGEGELREGLVDFRDEPEPPPHRCCEGMRRWRRARPTPAPAGGKEKT